MHIINSNKKFFTAIAKAADLCLKPWKHSVINEEDEVLNSYPKEISNDLFLRIECRDLNGKRHPENDIELEIFKSGKDINLMLCWLNKNQDIILWHGSHSIWMNGDTGKRIEPPKDHSIFESFARKIRVLLELPNEY